MRHAQAARDGRGRWTRTGLVAVAALVLGTAACDSPPAGATPDLHFATVAHGEHEPGTREWTVVTREGGRHEVIVRKTFSSVHPCPRLEADLLRVGMELTLRVTARDGGDLCERPGAPVAYEAVLDNVPPGHHELRVVHADDAPGQPAREIFRHAIVVR